MEKDSQSFWTRVAVTRHLMLRYLALGPGIQFRFCHSLSCEIGRVGLFTTFPSTIHSSLEHGVHTVFKVLQGPLGTQRHPSTPWLSIILSLPFRAGPRCELALGVSTETILVSVSFALLFFLCPYPRLGM